ncbi:MAG: OmpH family outer membrane protein [Mariprofundaceae bacterium]
MNTKWMAGGLALAMLVGGGIAQAVEMKFGYVDVKSAVENTQEYQKGIARLEALKSRKEKELKALSDKINAAEKELLGQSMAMSPERLAEKQQRIKEMRKDFRRRQQDAQEELVAEKNRLDMSIGAKFQKVIKAYGEKNHFDIIMPKAPLLYANPKFDVTADITKHLDQQK